MSGPHLSLLQVLEPSGGGSGRHFLDLCRSMQARGHAVTAIYSPVRAEDSFVAELKGLGLTGVHAVAMTRAPGPSDLAAWRRIKAISQDRGPFDIIHGHSSKAGALTRLGLPGRRTPVVYTPHAFRTMDPTLGSKGRLVFGGIERVLGQRFCDRVICVSRDEHGHALSLGIPDKRLSVVVNGVDRPQGGQRAAIRTHFGIPPDALTYGFVGRLAPQKAPERLVEAFAEVAARQPSARLLMIGAGELAPVVRNLIVELGLEGRAFLDDSIPGPSAIDAFDVVVVPSRYDAMSYVVLEAAAAGKPLIATDVGGARTVIDAGENGVLVDNSDDPAALADAMTRLAAPDALQYATRQAAQRRERFTLTRMAEETERVYFELLGLEPPAPLREVETALRLSA